MCVYQGKRLWIGGEPEERFVQKLSLFLVGLMERKGAGRERKTPFVLIRKSGCWEWCVKNPVTGYGVLTKDGKTKMAHRAVYKAIVGPIHDSLVCDHLCRNRGCVNPEHIEIVDSKTNVLRGVGITAKNKMKTHCIHGHSLKNAYLIHNGKSRLCRVCKVENNRRFGGCMAWKKALLRKLGGAK